MSNPWDLLSSTFDTKKNEDEISSHAADNILIAWPVILDFLDKHAQNDKKVRLLEYGCGGGGFAHKLSNLGYIVTGIDSSEEMINVARASYSNEVDFLVGGSSILSTLPPFPVITSVMTLQFIEDIEKTLIDLTNALDQDGVFVFAVHNPLFVTKCLQAETMLFKDFDSIEKPKAGLIELGSNKIPIYIRTAEEYNKKLESKGLQPLLEAYPPFTKEFLKKYPIKGPTEESEYLILGYKKVR